MFADRVRYDNFRPFIPASAEVKFAGSGYCEIWRIQNTGLYLPCLQNEMCRVAARPWLSRRSKVKMEQLRSVHKVADIICKARIKTGLAKSSCRLGFGHAERQVASQSLYVPRLGEVEPETCQRACLLCELCVAAPVHPRSC